MMDRIVSMGFPPDLAPIDDVVDMVRNARTIGADIKVDGWSASIIGASKLRKDFIDEVRNYREAVIFHFVVECPHPCESCWGVGVKQNEAGAWFCTGHFPDSPAKESLWRLAKAFTARADQITEYRNRDDYDEATYQQMLDDHQQRGNIIAQMWKSIEPNYPSTL
jgi:hypothetical protein